MGMNWNFHHRYYTKCIKCHKIHKKNQHELNNIKLSDEGTSAGLLYTMNNENRIKQDININTEEITDKESDEYSYLNKNQPAHIYKNTIDRATQKATQESALNSNHNMSQHHENINLDSYMKTYIPGDTVNTNPFEKLRQLQKQRASSEYYYSQEIQKIISEYFTADYSNNEHRRSESIERNRHIRAGI
ncbi:hypothetical protein PV327_005016 [Microctonus hyperodae]|uniref:Uncharacterized protein n=1 Tax=Microctonus hyperodae TaxID=165561 RepID=A0AA39FDR6_MICHY|nr:hypothetical protein PV327_005016 [Microctonus hyperodae]